MCVVITVLRKWGSIHSGFYKRCSRICNFATIILLSEDHLHELETIVLIPYINKMALSCFPQTGKQLKLSDGTTYAYVYIPAVPKKPTFLLLHGFPSSSYDWRHQVKALSNKGFGLLVPDLLGYGDTDAPGDVQAYSLKTMSGHIAEILDKEGISKVIGIAHDWYVSTRSNCCSIVEDIP
jgi:hypothetical protein